MKNHSRRKFIGNIVAGGLGVGALSSFTFPAKEKNSFVAAKEMRVINDVDIVVLGGSCTGVFAAVRAARLGAKVAIVEKQNSFGGH